MTFYDPNLFISVEGLLMENRTHVIERYIPSQLADSTAATITDAAYSAKTVVVCNFIFNILM